MRTPGHLKAHGFLYDSSLMGDDVPYMLETSHGPLIEVPVQWILDDAPLFRHVYGAGNVIADPATRVRPVEPRVRGDPPRRTAASC